MIYIYRIIKNGKQSKRGDGTQKIIRRSHITEEAGRQLIVHTNS